MSKKGRWQDKLNKQDMKHLRETMKGTPTLKGLKANREFHRKCMAEGESDPCRECAHIAVKLGLE